jgi:predicted dienelactone hydrolase
MVKRGWVLCACAALALAWVGCGEDDAGGDGGDNAANNGGNNANNGGNNADANNADNSATNNADNSADNSAANNATNNAANSGDNSAANNADNSATNNGEEEPLPPGPWSVEEAGPYRVGYHVETITYTPPYSDQARRIRIAFWYPTRAKEGAPVSYLTLRRAGILGGAPIGVEGEAPVMVFSHGSTSFPEQSFTMTEFFASHGWIIAAPEHTGNTFLDGDIPPEALEFRPTDIKATLDHLGALPDDNPTKGHLSDKVALVGHSFGGYTTLAVSGASFLVDTFEEECVDSPDGFGFCEHFLTEGTPDRFRAGFRDERIKAAIPMAPFGGPVFGDGVGSIEIPVMLMTARADATLPPEQDGDPIWDGLDGPDDIRLDFTTGGHFTFSDACLIGETLGINFGEGDGCGPAFISPEAGWEAINAYSLAFLRHHFEGDDTNLDLLTGQRTLDDSVLFYSKN